MHGIVFGLSKVVLTKLAVATVPSLEMEMSSRACLDSAVFASAQQLQNS
jgi:hypothetical protein